MRAVKYSAAGSATEVISLVEVEAPTPGPDEVVIQVGAVGLNPVDVKIRAAATNFGVIEYTDRPGWDVAGVITEVGEHVSGWARGDRVFALASFPVAAHTLADFAVVHDRDLAPAPAAWSSAQAGAAPLAALTAWQALDTAEVFEGQKVLVLGGAGGVGHLAIQLAVARGAQVIATASPAKHALVRSWGAQEVIDYRDEAALAAIGPVDAVIVTVENTLPPRGAIAEGAAVITITGFSAAQLDLLKEWGAGLIERILVRANGAQLTQISTLADAGQVAVHLDSQFPLNDVIAAHERVESGRVTGKVAVIIDPTV